MGENKYLKQAREELAYLSGDPDFQRLLESRAGFLMDVDLLKDEAEKKGKTDGITEGKAIGRAEGEAIGKSIGESIGKISAKIEIAKKMKQKNISIDQIIELTELTKDEIEKL